jgi:copper transport protein
LGRRLPVVGLALALALIPRAASAHALLLGSDPSPETVLVAPPEAISLTFTEAVIPVGQAIKVFSPTGRQVAGPARPVGHVLTAPVSAAETGTYVVTWQILAADTHPSRGAFGFVVGKASANPYAPLLTGGSIGTATPLGFGLQALARWMHFLGVALTFGTIAYQLVIRREPRLRRLVGAGLALLIAAEPVALVAQLASLSFDGDTAMAVLASGFGRLLGLRLAVVLLVWALLALESLWPVLGLGVVMALIDGATAHAIPGLPGAGLLLNAVHLAAMGLWVGALIGYLSAIFPSPLAGEGQGGGSRYALGAFAISVGSGLLLGLAHVGFPPGLATGYGWALVIKVVVVGIALGVAVLGRRRAEFGVVAVILAVAAVLVSLPPPR